MIFTEQFFRDHEITQILVDISLEIHKRYYALYALLGRDQGFDDLRRDIHIHRNDAVRQPSVAVSRDYDSSFCVIADQAAKVLRRAYAFFRRNALIVTADPSEEAVRHGCHAGSESDFSDKAVSDSG